jgi:hypothetical protein
MISNAKHNALKFKNKNKKNSDIIELLCGCEGKIIDIKQLLNMNDFNISESVETFDIETIDIIENDSECVEYIENENIDLEDFEIKTI